MKDDCYSLLLPFPESFTPPPSPNPPPPPPFPPDDARVHTIGIPFICFLLLPIAYFFCLAFDRLYVPSRKPPDRVASRDVRCPEFSRVRCRPHPEGASHLPVPFLT